ncbi:MAG: hypothetical protein HQ538_06310 [Parcubacteria group bacterium]|nr:hypothetical protein [Parcubacteria group bacterium]
MIDWCDWLLNDGGIILIVLVSIIVGVGICILYDSFFKSKENKDGKK